MRRALIGAALTAPIAVAAGCGYPTFSYGPAAGGTGGATTTTTTTETSMGGRPTSSSSSSASSSSTSASTSASSAASSSTSASSTGGPTCMLDHLVISELRTRGPGGGDDSFVELYNPTPFDVVLDQGWALESRGATAALYDPVWIGNGGTIPAFGHYLIAHANYTQAPAADDKSLQSISDAGGLRLMFGFLTVDRICFYADPVSLGLIQSLFFDCEGGPIPNPHDNTTGTNTDKSLSRTPNDCTDTDDNPSDFHTQTPATPHNASDPPVP